MRSLRAQGVLMTLALLAVGGVVGAHAQETADQSAISAVYDTYMDGINNLNADEWLGIWDDDGIKMDPDTKAIEGKAAITAAVKARFSSFSAMAMEISVAEIVVSGDYAFARGGFHRSITVKAGSAPLLFDGKFVSILRRQSDGSWKLFRDIYNSNGGPK